MTMQHQAPHNDECDFTPIQKQFMADLLNGSVHSAIGLASRVKSVAHLKSFYLQVVQPTMYEVGQLWESGNISVSQEHAASAIVSRVMATLQAQFLRGHPSRGRAVVAAIANEYHELGAWIVADMLELDGWEVCYLGANTPLKSIAEMVVRLSPDLLALSMTMPFNVEQVRGLIAELRHEPKTKDVVILVGGRALNSSPDSWKSLGADGYAADFETAVRYARNVWESLLATKRM